MKEAKKQRKKTIPHHFQKRSRSNTSLSQILCVGTYKKRIIDLARNNRRLAVELNNFRLENARLNSQLKVCKNQQIVLARLKLNKMAITIKKLATDMEEVNSYLDGNWKTNIFQEKVFHDKLKIKSPDISFIEEASPCIETPNREDSMEIITSDQQSSEIHNENPNTSELPPILFVEDSGEKIKEKSSSSGKNSRRLNITEEGLLTPKLDDIGIYRRKTSSRRQTQKLLLSEERKTTSRGKTMSSGRKTVADQSTTSIEVLTQPITTNEQDCIEDVEIQNGKVSENIDVASPNLCNDSLNKNNVNPNIQVVSSMDFCVNNKANVPPNIQPVDNTIIACEDMELTDVLNPFITVAVGNGFPPLNIASANDEILKQTGMLHSHSDGSNLLPADSKLLEIGTSDDIHNNTPCNDKSVSDSQFPFSDKSIREQEAVLQNTNNNLKECEQILDDSFSPFPIKLLRKKKSVNYNVFSSDESDDSIPVRELLNNRNKNKSLKEKFFEKASSSIDKESSEDINKKAKCDLSVYDLDVSNSKMTKSQKAKSRRDKKTTQKKDQTKFLLPNCEVTKLKNGGCKFSKNETTSKSKEISCLLESKPTLEVNSTHDALNSSLIDETNVMETQNTQHIKNVRKSILITSKYNHNTLENSRDSQIGTPRSESKRVSFASIDIVYKYKNMSNNERGKCISKHEKSKNTLKTMESDAVSEITTNRKLEAKELLNFNEETELYAFPLNVCAVTDTNNTLQREHVTMKVPNEQVENIKNKEMIQASSKYKEMSSIKNAVNFDSDTSPKITTVKELTITEEQVTSNKTELHILPSNAHMIAEPNTLVNEHLKNKQFNKESLAFDCATPEKQVSGKSVKHSLTLDKTQEKSSLSNILDYRSDTIIEIAAIRKMFNEKEDLNSAATELVADIENADIEIHNLSPPILVAEHSECEQDKGLKKRKNKQGKIPEKKKVKNASKISKEPKSNNILGKEIQLANNITISEKLGAKELNSCVKPDNPSFAKNMKKEQNKENLILKSTHSVIKPPQKLGKLSLKVNKISQKEDKTVKDNEFQLVNTNSREKDKFLCNSPWEDAKENEINPDHETADISQGTLKIKSKPSTDSLNILSANSSSKVSTSRNNQSTKYTTIQQSPKTSMKKKMKKTLEFSPALSDVINFEIDALPKRRSRNVVNYKEPSLTKKLRRE